MKKLLAIILAGLMLMCSMSLTVFADDEQASLSCTNGDGKVTLSWEDTDDESYDVYWKRSSSEEWKLAGTTTKHKVNIIGLKNGISYQFKVEIGEEFSETVTATPKEDFNKLLSFSEDGSRYTASDLENAYTYQVLSDCVIEYGIFDDKEMIDPYLEMYYALGDIIEPTDETMDFYQLGFVFEVDGETYAFYVDKNNVVKFSTFGDRYKITADGVDYYSQLSEMI